MQADEGPLQLPPNPPINPLRLVYYPPEILSSRPGPSSLAVSDGTMSALDASYESMVAAMKRLSLTSSHDENDLRPVNRLPADLIYAIFDLVIVERPDKRFWGTVALQMSHVCYHWRETLLNYRRVWSFIDLTMRSEACADFYIQRSHGYPLTVFYVGGIWRRKFLSRNISQIRYLHALADPGEWVEGLTAPLLETLAITLIPQVPLILLNQNVATPSLRKLMILGAHIPLPFYVHRGLTELKIHDMKPYVGPQDVKACLEVLKQLPYIQVLELSFSSRQPPHPQVIERSTPIAMNALRKMIVRLPDGPLVALLLSSMAFSKPLEHVWIETSLYSSIDSILCPAVLPPNAVQIMAAQTLYVDLRGEFTIVVNHKLDGKAPFLIRQPSHNLLDQVVAVGRLLKRFYPTPTLKRVLFVTDHLLNGSVDYKEFLPFVQHTSMIEELSVMLNVNLSLLRLFCEVLWPSTRSTVNVTDKLWPHLKRIRLMHASLGPLIIKGLSPLCWHICAHPPEGSGRHGPQSAPPILFLIDCVLDDKSASSESASLVDEFVRLHLRAPCLQVVYKQLRIKKDQEEKAFVPRDMLPADVACKWVEATLEA